MRIAGMMRVKNEERWIEDSIKSILPLCERIIVLDDNSTDGTLQKCLHFGSETMRVIGTPFRGLDEARDKNYLLGRVLDCGPDWILHIDGDEILEDGGAERLMEVLCINPSTAFGLQISYMWDHITQVRVDGRFSNFIRASLFKTDYVYSGYKCTPWGDGANLHCGNIPTGFREVEPLPIRLKHYGYMLPEDRAKKRAYYSQFAQPGDGFPWKISEEKAKFEEWRP